MLNGIVHSKEFVPITESTRNDGKQQKIIIITQFSSKKPFLLSFFLAYTFFLFRIIFPRGSSYGSFRRRNARSVATWVRVPRCGDHERHRKYSKVFVCGTDDSDHIMRRVLPPTSTIRRKRKKENRVEEEEVKVEQETQKQKRQRSRSRSRSESAEKQKQKGTRKER